MENVKQRAIEEIKKLKEECLTLMEDIERLRPADRHSHEDGVYRLVAIPMLYSVWERCFTVCQAVSLRRIRDMKRYAHLLEAPQRAIWLLQQPFYRSFVTRLRQGLQDDGVENKRLKKGEFASLAEFLTNLEEWTSGEINKNQETEKLVMTFSNVNNNVVNINAKAIGIYKCTSFGSVDFGRLHELVGRRNDIGHGVLVTPPGPKEFEELWIFTEKLINSYCAVFEEWIEDMAKVNKQPDGNEAQDAAPTTLNQPV